MRIIWLCLALLLSGLAIYGWLFVQELEWAAKEPFDIIGLLWLLSNLESPLVVTGLLVCAGFAVYCWLCLLYE